LPAPKSTLIPTVNIAPAVGWGAGEAPTPAEGMLVTAFATDLDHPRTLFVLRHGARPRHFLRRRHRRVARLHLHPRRDAHHFEAGENRRPARRHPQPPLDQEPRGEQRRLSP